MFADDWASGRHPSSVKEESAGIRHRGSKVQGHGPALSAVEAEALSIVLTYRQHMVDLKEETVVRMESMHVMKTKSYLTGSTCAGVPILIQPRGIPH